MNTTTATDKTRRQVVVTVTDTTRPGWTQTQTITYKTRKAAIEAVKGGATPTQILPGRSLYSTAALKEV